ncbi:hypothetical protein O6H91_20G042300 [Diphasiastrum complanatum]|uniref:Uncharacterized protein n=1 Tax=Diphasiastrum complanatum TaxID=34168 RepID=A0ACC2APX2_DIPCM|nr:hypothetical protein O6H91_20G042300 [Diphasiastrum complanatum]
MAQKYGEYSSSTETKFMHADPVHLKGEAKETIPTSGSTTQSHFCGLFESRTLSWFLLCPCMQRRTKEEFKDVEKDRIVDSSSTSLEGSSLSHAQPRISADAFFEPPEISGSVTLNFAEITKITNNFSNSHIIGHGGFGVVYKGQLRDGRVVAIKRGKKEARESRVDKEFQNELTMLSSVEHINLVRLIGFFENERERILLVEYVSNGNLREHLDGQYGVTLDLATRLDIAIDVAHALTYLHMYADKPIIHRDIKSSNILLTDTFRAKVADFGFSRTGPTEGEETHISTKVKGTAGYLDPEYLQTYHITPKSDVYSYGVLLVEIISGRRPIEVVRPSRERITIRWAYDKMIEGKVVEILDSKLELTRAASIVTERITELAFQCLAPTKKDRPTMQEVDTVLWNIRKHHQNSSQAPSPRVSSHDLRAR